MFVFVFSPSSKDCNVMEKLDIIADQVDFLNVLRHFSC